MENKNQLMRIANESGISNTQRVGARKRQYVPIGIKRSSGNQYINNSDNNFSYKWGLVIDCNI